MLCLPNSRIVEAVVHRMMPAFSEGQVLIDTGTSSLSSTRRVCEWVTRRGVRFAEAPLTGGARQAARGELGALVGAEEELFLDIRPLLETFCSSVQHFGPVGAGGRAKLINNYMVMGIAALVFEAFHLADLAESDWERLYEVVVCGSANSGVLHRVIGNAVKDDYEGYQFDVKSASKDLRYLAELTDSLGRDTPLNRAVLEFFARAEAEGYGDLLISELLRPEVRKRRGGV